MESPPGSVPAPTWHTSLPWRTAGAFRVRWLVVADTLMNSVGHLRNAFNRHHPVFRGLDGQEIEASCGERLVEIMDEHRDGPSSLR